MVDKKGECKDHATLTSSDLKTILEVNKKSAEIYVEVEQQNEDILKDLSFAKDRLQEIDNKIVEMDKSLFRLIVLLGTLVGSLGLGTVIAIIQWLLSHH